MKITLRHPRQFVTPRYAVHIGDGSVSEFTTLQAAIRCVRKYGAVPHITDAAKYYAVQQSNKVAP